MDREEIQLEENLTQAVSQTDRLMGDLSKSLISQLYVTIKTAQVYEQNNLAFLKQSQNLKKVLDKLLDLAGQISIRIKDGYIFVNDLRLKFDFAGYIGNKFIIEEFNHYQIEALYFEVNVSQREVDKFIYLLIHLDRDSEASFENLHNRILDLGITTIKLEKKETKEGEVTPILVEEDKKIAKKIFFKAVNLVQNVMTNVHQEKFVNVTKAKRIVQNLVDRIIADEAIFVELTAFKNFDEYTFVHSANVSVMSIILGLRLGLDRVKLSELGFAALFHDIGKAKLPIDLINKPSDFDELDWQLMKKHPVLGVKTLVSSRDLDNFTIRAAVVAFEHHLNLDLSGYPKIKNPRELNLFTRIVDIVDAYDSMASGRVYMRTPIPPYEVLRRMLYKSGTGFDSTLLKVFINIVGVYPIGSLVVLDTDEIGLVYKASPENIYRPKVRIIADKNGKKEIVEIVDLTKKDETSGQYKRSIVRGIDPKKYNIDVWQYFTIT